MEGRCLLLCMSALLLLLPTEGVGGVRVGGWSPIHDLGDPHVQEIGKYAVSEYNKRAKAGLKLEKVVKGETQVVSGTNYRLDLAVKDKDQAGKTYQAVVWEKAWAHFRNLTSFEPLPSRLN